MNVVGAKQLSNTGHSSAASVANHVSTAVAPKGHPPASQSATTMTSTTTATTLHWEQNFEAKIRDLKPQEQEAVRRFWRSVVMRNAPRLFGDENGRLPQLYAGNPAVAANVRNCSCCPYGYHIDLDFVRYCESLANAKPSAEELQRRSRRRSRKSMEFMLGFDALCEQWDTAARVQQAVPEVPHEQHDSPDDSPRQHTSNNHHFNYATATSTPRPRSSSVPRYTYGAATPARPESPFGTASSTCSSVRGAESDAPYSMLIRQRQQQGHQSRRDAPETRAFLRDALDEVCSDFERTLERTSLRRKKLANGCNGYGGGVASDRNNNSSGKQSPPTPPTRMSSGTNWTRGGGASDSFAGARNAGGGGYVCNSKRTCYTWERTVEQQTLDSCIAGNKSPRTARYLAKASAATLPPHQKLSPAEQQYESYVQATVAANAKSPVEQVLPPPPPPRRHAPPTQESSLLDDVDRKPTQVDGGAMSTPFASPLSTNGGGAESGSAATEAQTLFSIRQQMALSLKRMKDLEEQVKSIPELQHELTRLRDEKQRLQQTLQRKEDELQRTREAPRASASPSPAASLKNGASPVSFTPQRISPISLESMGSRLRANSTSSERQLRSTPPTFKRDVGTMCGLHATRDIAVGSPVHMMRSVGTSPAQQLRSITDTLHSKLEMEEHTEIEITRYEERRAAATEQPKKETANAFTQVATPRCVDGVAQTTPVRKTLKTSVSVMAKPQMLDTGVNCRPLVRSVATSEDTILLPLCEKCCAEKRSIASSTEDAGFTKITPVSLKLLNSSTGFLRSNTFSLGEQERLGRIFKSTATQYTPVPVHSAGCQTAAAYLRSTAVQCAAEQRHVGAQSAQVRSETRQTDTRDLIRLCATQTSTEEYVPPPPEAPAPPITTAKTLQKPALPPKPTLRTTASNTDKPRTMDHGINTLPPAAIRHTAANTDTVRKRDIGCGDVVKPHISIACAANYCDSCKDAIKNLAKDFSKVLTPQSPPSPLSPLAQRPRMPPRSASMDSRIPLRKNIPPSPSPVRRSFQRQNTYTITTTSPEKNKAAKTTKSSLQEKPPSIAQFLPNANASETQSFIRQPEPSKAKSVLSTITASSSSAASSRRASDASQKRSVEAAAQEVVSKGQEDNADDETKPLKPSLDGLLVREEKRVSVSWSRDASPAASPYRSLESSFTEQQSSKQTTVQEEEEASSAIAVNVSEENVVEEKKEDNMAVDVSKGARRKTTTTTPTKSSQIPSRQQKESSQTSETETTTQTAKKSTKTTTTTTKTTTKKQLKIDDEQQQKQQQQQRELEEKEEEERRVKQERPPSKALLQKLAMVEAEPRNQFVPPAEMLSALKLINNSLLKKIDAKSLSAASLKSSKLAIQQEWFRVSSTEKANPLEVEDYFDCFEEMSVALLEYCVNMVDANGNTAMHYAVSHGNFDVVSILLDSKVCNVNQMNNAGYTCVMLVSLAKLKNAAHRTVVQRLFQMADVNIRAKKHCQTALMLAVSHGNYEMVELLLAAGADINIQDEDGSTALMCAAEHGRTDIVKHLLSQPDCDSLIVDVDGATAFKIAWQAGHRDLGLLLYVHEQMLRSKQPNRGDATGTAATPHVSLELPRQTKAAK